MFVSAMMTCEVVVVEGVEAHFPATADGVGEADAEDEAGIEAVVLVGEVAGLIEGLEVDVVVCHPVGSALAMLTEPVARIAAGEQVAAELGSTEGEVGQHRDHEVGVEVLGVDGVEVVEVAVHAV